MRPRVIPVLLIEDRYVVKTSRFKKPVYIGDPINSVKLFNEKQADELLILDVLASQPRHAIDYDFIEHVVSEAFMPVAYGGGIRTLDEAARIFGLGVEKVVLNTALVTMPHVLGEIAAHFGVQSVVASIDVGRSRLPGRLGGGAQVLHDRARKPSTRLAPPDWARELERQGAGEIFLTSVVQEGTRSGYDLSLVRDVSTAVSIPVVAHGGASSLHDFRQAVEAGASAVAAGSFFVQHGTSRGVLITYPTDAELTAALSEEQAR